jgi:hypothetical protein
MDAISLLFGVGLSGTEVVMRIIATLILLAAAVPIASAQDAARSLLQRAIVAHGGLEKLASARADKVRLQGTLHVGGTEVPFTNEVTLQLPGQFKSIVRITEGERTTTLTHILDGERAAITLDGHPQPVTGSHLAQMRQTLQLDQAMKLVPLLTDPAFTVTYLGEYQYNNRIVAGIRVVGHGQRDLRLYFDRETALLVKSEHLLDGAGGKDVRQEACYSEYREAGGYLRPGRVTAYRDGKKVMEAALIDARRFDRIDPIEFAVP